MFTVCVGLIKFLIICSLQYSININTVEVDPNSDLLHICIVKPKNTAIACTYLKNPQLRLSSNFILNLLTFTCTVC